MRFWFFVFLLLPILANVYILWHVYRILPLVAWAKWTVVGVMVAAFLLLFVGIFGSRWNMPFALNVVVYEIGTSWIMILLYLFMIFLALDLGRLCHVVPATLLNDSTKGTLGITLLVTAIFVYGNIHYNHKYRQPLTLTTNKELKRPLKVVMMSDLHAGYHNRRAEIARWVDMINAEHADLILIAGDIIDNSTKPLDYEGVAQEFRRLNAPVMACLGNHEYLAGTPNAQHFFDEAGITLLRDSVVEWEGLRIVGRDDRSNPHRKSIKELLGNTSTLNPPPSTFTILLDHQPYNLVEAEQTGVDFQLSGHTHRGQVWPISWITDAVYECSFGEWQRGATRYYVSSGIGIWGGKFRIGTRSEYVVAEIING